MACVVSTLPMNAWTATDAGFRIWGKAWTDIIDVMGFEQVYSNIDWSTVVMPTVSSTYGGKRVYKFNDSLSATREIYFSVEFGRGGSLTTAQYGFAIRLVVGTGYDGLGNITNFLFSNYFLQTQAPTDGGEIIGVKSHLGFSIFTNLNTSTFQAGFAIERLAINTVPSTDGAVCMLTGTGVNTGSSQTGAAFQTANYAAANVFPVVGPQGSSSTDLLFSNVQSIPKNVDPSYATKAPAVTMDTFGKYDACYHWTFANRYMYSPASEFVAVINGVEGLFRIPVTGFHADSGSTTYVILRLGMRVA